MKTIRAPPNERIFMAIRRTVITKVKCDICGKEIGNWGSESTGVSREWAKYFVRKRGCTVGGQVICRACRIRKRRKECAMIKKYGAPQLYKDGTCLGFQTENSDEPVEKCKRCIAYNGFD